MVSEDLFLKRISSVGKKLISEYDGRIFGKTANHQALFYFNVQNNWNMTSSISVQEKVKANLTSLTDFVFLNVLKFHEQAGINVPSLRLF